VPGVFDPGNTGCVHATFSNGVLHLEKNCPTSTNAAAGAPRFDIQTTTGFFFLRCNNVIPVGNTYAFDAATIAAAGNQVPVPTGDIVSISVLIDVEGTADLTNITVTGRCRRQRHRCRRATVRTPAGRRSSHRRSRTRATA
jgi:hypothetical protein